MSNFVQRHGQVQEALGDIEVFLQVSGDKSDENYRSVSGYWYEAAVGGTIYILPMAIAIIAVYLLWK